MATDDVSLGKALGILLGVSSPVIVVAGYKAYRTGRLGRAWRRLRVWALGGVTTLERALEYNCGLCGGSMDAGEEVRTLSCDHAFHHCKSEKCKDVIDHRLRENSMACPTCGRIARPVLPWKAPPTSAPAASDLEDPLLRQASSPSPSSSGSPLPLSTMPSGEALPLLQSSPGSQEPRPQQSLPGSQEPQPQ